MENNLPAKPSTTGSVVKIYRSGVKIRELKNTVPIEQALGYCFVLVGLDKDKYPDRLEKQVLVDHVYRSWPGLVAEEIKVAFRMAVNRELDVDPVCYHQRFSCEYISRIMAPYLEYRKAEFAKHSATEFKETRITVNDYFEKMLFTPYDRMLNGGKYPFSELDGWILYRHLRDDGHIALSEEEKKQHGKEARMITPKKKRDKLTDPEESKEEHDQRILKVAQAMAFKEWIQDQAMNGVNLRELILNQI